MDKFSTILCRYIFPCIIFCLSTIGDQEGVIYVLNVPPGSLLQWEMLFFLQKLSDRKLKRFFDNIISVPNRSINITKIVLIYTPALHVTSQCSESHPRSGLKGSQQQMKSLPLKRRSRTPSLHLIPAVQGFPPYTIPCRSPACLHRRKPEQQAYPSSCLA